MTMTSYVLKCQLDCVSHSSDVKKAPRALEKDGKMLNINEGKYV